MCVIVRQTHAILLAGAATLVLQAAEPTARLEPVAARPAWASPNHYRLRLAVHPQGRVRSHSPASVEIDFQQALANHGADGLFDENTVEVVVWRATTEDRMVQQGLPQVRGFGSESTSSGKRKGGRQDSPEGRATGGRPAPYRVPHRLDRYFGVTRVTLNFVMPDQTCTNYAVYFDTVESRLGRPQRYPGLVGDGDFFSEGYRPREINGSHFDQFCDFDGDGDLDLFKGGVEPYVYCFENVGGNQLVSRGRLTSGGSLFTLPKSKSNRSWVTVAFYDWDMDGDQDFFPSFGDGPDRGRIVLYRNSTREHGDRLTFGRVGPLQTVSGVPLAGGAQAGGWFPSICFVEDWDGEGDGRTDVLVGSNHRCYLYRNLGPDAQGLPRLADAVAVQAGGMEINLINPRFDCADIDGDGDLDLFAGTQSGPVSWFRNAGTRTRPDFAPGTVIGFGGKYLIGDAHSGVKVADFDADGRLDLVAGRFWERMDLSKVGQPRDHGGLYRNVGPLAWPRFKRAHEKNGSPCTRQFQRCDAVRQNSARATDWDRDGKLDLLAGDTDGFIWHFRNESNPAWPVCATGQRLRAGGRPLHVSDSGGHARFDICDWNNDGQQDLVVADGSGTVTLFLNRGSPSRPALRAGQKVLAAGQPIQAGARASVLACDWDNDGRKDLLLADEIGYYFYRNMGTDANPALAAAKAVRFNGRPVNYVRPNLGSLVDWDGDGKKDLIGCQFENSIRFYRNIGSGARQAEPEFSDPEGIVIVQGSSPQMISGADAVDWNGDGDLDILTGQGHGGSGLRYFERDWIEDEMNNTHPMVRIETMERKEQKQSGRPTDLKGL